MEQESIIDVVSKQVFSAINNNNEKKMKSNGNDNGDLIFNFNFNDLKKEFNLMYTNFMGFFHAVSWEKEKWLHVMLGLYILLIITVVYSRKNINMQVCLIYF